MKLYLHTMMNISRTKQNKTLVTALSAVVLSLALVLLPNQADAWSKRAKFFFTPYLGLAYQYINVNSADDGVFIFPNDTVSFDYDDYLEDSYNSFNVYFGARVHKRISFEISRFQSSEETMDVAEIQRRSGPAEVDSELSGWNYDFIYHYRFGKRWEGILSLGVTDLEIDIDESPLGNQAVSDVQDEDDVFPRYGIGFQYDFSKRLKIRGIMHYMDSDFASIDDMWSAHIGAHIQFE